MHRLRDIWRRWQRGRESRLLALTLVSFGWACSSEPAPHAYLTASIAADDAVAGAVDRLRVELYAADAKSGAAPLAAKQLEQLSWSTDGVEVTLAIERDTPLILVVEGLGADSSRVLVERKLETRVLPGQQRRVAVYLGAACLGVSDCADLDVTCYPVSRAGIDAGACGAVEPATTQVYVPLPDVDATADADASDADGDAASLDAGTSDAGAEAAALDAANASEASIPEGYLACGEGSCHPAYPCIEGRSGAYSCAGQMAEWPIPNANADGPRRPNFAQLADGGVTFDRVTGLLWQRQLPDTYAGCTGKAALAGDRCSWEEARAYCAQLQLADRAWRLPGRVELISTLDFTKFSFPKSPYPTDLSVFPLAADKFVHYWSSSPVTTTSEPPPISGAIAAWMVSSAGYAAVTEVSEGKRVRCVASEYEPTAAPGERYSTDEGADTVTDTRTQLEWERQVPTRSLTIDEAKARCAARGPGFRLPSAAELASLSDPVRAVPSVRPPLKGASPATFLWTEDLGFDGSPMVMLEAIGMLQPYGVFEESLPELPALGVDLGQVVYLARCVR